MTLAVEVFWSFRSPYSYLATGDKYYEEELAFWAMYPSSRWPHTGILPATTRASAWQLRNCTDAAFLLPDAHPRKKYLADYVARNLEFLNQFHLAAVPSTAIKKALDQLS